MPYSPKKLNPVHLIMIRLHWQGESNIDIAMKTGYTPQQVSNVLCSEAAQTVINGLQSEVLDTMAQVQTDAQFMAPKFFDNIVKIAESATDERVRLHANLAGIGIAGHVPVRRIQVQGDTANTKKYEDMSEEEIRQDISGELAKGPDGSTLQ
jgi:hypothetical protein